MSYDDDTHMYTRKKIEKISEMIVLLFIGAILFSGERRVTFRRGHCEHKRCFTCSRDRRVLSSKVYVNEKMSEWMNE